MGPLRHQGPRHHLRVGRGRRQDPQRGAGQVRGRHQRAARRDRPLVIHRGPLGREREKVRRVERKEGKKDERGISFPPHYSTYKYEERKEGRTREREREEEEESEERPKNEDSIDVVEERKLGASNLLPLYKPSIINRT